MFLVLSPHGVQRLLEVGVLGVFVFFVSGGLPLLIGFVEGERFIANPAADHLYSIGDYMVYTALIAALTSLGVSVLVVMGRGPDRFLRMMPVMVLVMLVSVMLLVAGGMTV